MNVVLVTFVVLLLLFLLFFFYKTDPRRMMKGFLFNLLFILIIGLYIYLSFALDERFLKIIAFIPLSLFIFASIFGLFVLIVGLLINGRNILKREGRRFSNSLSFLLGIVLLVYWIISLMNPTELISDDWKILFTGVSAILLYMFMDIANFLTASILYQFNKPKYNQDFVIVHGSGLIHDKVPPLLASRIDKAIEFYWMQSKVASPPKLIFSGGKGSDENVSEAEAMQIYAIEKGIPIEDTIQENQSRSTYENLLYSKRIMESINGEKYNSIFVSNNFHIFRAGMYARQLGLDSHCIGSKTVFYYWLNAMIREYIAIFVMQRKRHFFVIGGILGLFILLFLITVYIESILN